MSKSVSLIRRQFDQNYHPPLPSAIRVIYVIHANSAADQKVSEVPAGIEKAEIAVLVAIEKGEAGDPALIGNPNNVIPFPSVQQEARQPPVLEVLASGQQQRVALAAHH